MRHLFNFASQIFENNDLAFFEAAIDALPVPQPISANVSLLLIWSFSNAIEVGSISVRAAHHFLELLPSP
jgi:hypothetical protein